MTTSKLGFVALKSLKQQGPQDAAAILGELRTIYFKTTKQTIDADFAQRGWIKLEIGLAKGKKQYDKREAEKEKDWQRDKQRLLREKQKA